MKLGEPELRAIEERGFSALPGFLAPPLVERLRRVIDELGPRMRARTPPGVEVLWEETDSGAPPRIKQLLHAELVSEDIARLLASREMLEALEPLLGPDVDLFEVKILAKAERVGTAVPWHQDFPYWRHLLREPLVVSCMFYLDDADAENGCLEVIAGSHRLGALDHSVIGGDDFNRRLARPIDAAPERIPAPAGTAILFPPLLAHASSPNASARPRRAFTAVFTAAGNGASRGRVARGDDDAEVEHWLALDRVPRVAGPGPHGGQCAAHYRRREVRKLALASLTAEGAWLQVGCGESGTFEWLAARKRAGTPLHRLDPLPSPATPRAEVERHTSLADVRAGLGAAPIACLHLESGYYATAARVFAAVGESLAPGAVVILDRLYAFDGWRRQAAKALREWAEKRGVALEPIVRADTAVAFRVGATGSSAGAPNEPPVLAQGLSFVTGDVASPPQQQRRLAALRRFRSRLEREARRLSPEAALFPELDIPRFVGDGDPNGDCPTHARRRALWGSALARIDDPRLPWAEFGVGEGESLDWLAAHKPAETPLFGFDSFEGIPEPWLDLPAGQWKSPAYVSHRPDVRIVRGRFEETLADRDVRELLRPRLGFLHVDCDLYSSTRAVLEALATEIGPGTVIVFDELYGYPGWRRHELRALVEFCRRHLVEIEWLGRSDTQAALRVVSVGTATRATVRAMERTELPVGIRLEREPSLARWILGRLRPLARRMAGRLGGERETLTGRDLPAQRST